MKLGMQPMPVNVYPVISAVLHVRPHEDTTDWPVRSIQMIDVLHPRPWVLRPSSRGNLKICKANRCHETGWAY